MDKPMMIDLFCGAGGAAQGYLDAGFEVLGVDIEDQPEYPGHFYQGDCMDFLRMLIATPSRNAVFIHASPPCQAHSALTKGTNLGKTYLDFIPPTRAMLNRIGLPYVIENVAGAPIRKDVMLCGEMFGLGVIRHRYFEVSGWSCPQPVHPKHRGRVAGYRHGEWFQGPYFAVYGQGGGKGSLADWQQAMGMPWVTTRHGLAEAIPPAYTRYLGTQFAEVWRGAGADQEAPDGTATAEAGAGSTHPAGT